MMIPTSIPMSQHRLWILPIYWDNLSLTIALSIKYLLKSLSWRTFRESKPNSNSSQRISNLFPMRPPRSRVRLRKRVRKNLQSRSRGWMRRLIHSWGQAPLRWTASRLDLPRPLSLEQPIRTLLLVDNHCQLEESTKETNLFSQMNMKPQQNSHRLLVIHSLRPRNLRRKLTTSSRTIRA